MLDESDFRIYFVPFTGDVKALVTICPDGYYSIYVNSNLPFEVQKEAVKHELRHILHNDFYNNEPIQEIEGR